MVYRGFKDLPRRIASDKVLIKHLILLNIQSMMDIKGLVSMVYIFFDKKPLVVLLKVKIY